MSRCSLSARLVKNNEKLDFFFFDFTSGALELEMLKAKTHSKSDKIARSKQAGVACAVVLARIIVALLCVRVYF